MLILRENGLLTMMCELVIAIVLAVTNTLAFSRCDKFSQATNIATGAFSASGLASNLGGAVLGRFFR
jgi:hypothetical protein